MNPITVLNKGNVPIGPFTRAQIAEKLQSGEIALTDLAFAEGLGFSQWVPLRDVLAKADGPAAVIPAPPVAAPSSAAPPSYSYAATMQPPPHLVYAGFWLRFAAYFIDTLIISIGTFIVAFIIAMICIFVGGAMGLATSLKQANTNDASPAMVAVIIVLEFVLWGGSMIVFWLYFAKQESGPAQATFGKRALGLRVTDMSGQRIGFGRATGRTFGKFVSALPMDIGFIMAGFTERKQALHDMIAGTLVVKE